jgi:hypothetical protein
MHNQTSLWRRAISLMTLACFVPMAVGCTDDDPGGRLPQGVEVTVTVKDSSGGSLTATSDLDAETYPALARVDGGAPVDPQRIFVKETIYTLDTGDTLRFLPGEGGTEVLHNGAPLGVTLSWDAGTRTVHFAAANGSWVDAQLDLTGDTAAYYGGALALGGVIDAIIDVEFSSAVPVPVIIAGIGLAAYLACVTLGCNYMCKNTCSATGVMDCGCGIKVWRNNELGYWCKCNPPPPPRQPPQPTDTETETQN